MSAASRRGCKPGRRQLWTDHELPRTMSIRSEFLQQRTAHDSAHILVTMRISTVPVVSIPIVSIPTISTSISQRRARGTRSGVFRSRSHSSKEHHLLLDELLMTELLRWTQRRMTVDEWRAEGSSGSETVRSERLLRGRWRVG